MATKKTTKPVVKKEDTKPVGANGMAIAGFVCSFFVAILGVIFGIVGLSQIKKTGEGGKGLAIAGIVIGGVSIVACIIAIIWVVFVGLFAVNKISESPVLRSIDCGYEYEHINGTYKSVWRCD